MTRPETRDAERLMRDVAKQRVSRRGLMKGAAAVGLALPATAAMQPYGPAATAQDAPLGSSLIGELEGPIVLVDAPRPENLKQAPMLAELVKAGKLPPVEQRVPEEPMVIKPVEAIGKYGGTWRRAFTGPGDGENGNRIISMDKLVFWDYTGRQAAAVRWPRAGRSATAARRITFSCARATSGRTASRSPPTTSCSGTRTSTGTRIWSRTPHAAVLDQRQARGASRRWTRRPSASSSRIRTRSSWTIMGGSTYIGSGTVTQTAGSRWLVRAGALPQAVPPEVHRPG